MIEGSLAGVRVRDGRERDAVARLAGRAGPADESDNEPDEETRASRAKAGIQFKPSPSTSARAARVASGEQVLHMVASVKFGDDRRATCSCGRSFAGRTDASMAYDFHDHVRRAFDKVRGVD